MNHLLEDRPAADPGNLCDAVCRQLLSERYILAHILKGCMPEYEPFPVEEIASMYIQGAPEVYEVPVHPQMLPALVDGLSQVDSSPAEGTVVFDIRLVAILPHTDEPTRLIINLEAQNRFHPGYPLVKRGVYYCGRMISSQYETVFTNSHYEKLCKVTSIWVCQNPPSRRANSIQRYRLGQEEVFGASDEDIRNYDMISIVMLCLGKELSQDIPPVLRLLNTLFSLSLPPEEKLKRLVSEFQIPLQERIESEVKDLCNFSYGYYQQGVEAGVLEGREAGILEGREAGILEGREAGILEGREAGILEGREAGILEGREAGILEGIEDTILQNVQTLMRKLSFTAEQALAFLEVAPEQWEQYLSLLAEKSSN